MDNLLAGAVVWVWEARGDAHEVRDAKLPVLGLVATPHQPVVKPRRLREERLGESVASVLLETLVATRIPRTRPKSERRRFSKTQSCQPHLLVFPAERLITSTR